MAMRKFSGSADRSVITGRLGVWVGPYNAAAMAVLQTEISSDALPRASGRSHVTLALCTVLHAFTHAYGTMLVPLYLLMVADLRLGGVKAASLIVTLYA